MRLLVVRRNPLWKEIALNKEAREEDEEGDETEEDGTRGKGEPGGVAALGARVVEGNGGVSAPSLPFLSSVRLFRPPFDEEPPIVVTDIDEVYRTLHFAAEKRRCGRTRPHRDMVHYICINVYTCKCLKKKKKTQ